MNLRKMMALGHAVGRNEIDRVELLCAEAIEADEQDLEREA